MSEPGAIRRLPRPGTIVPFGGDTIPSGWLLCNGAAVSRTGYARLYSAIGTAWGSGDGSTTFNLPDGRGKVLQGADSTNSLGVEIEAGMPEVDVASSTRGLVMESGNKANLLISNSLGLTNAFIRTENESTSAPIKVTTEYGENEAWYHDDYRMTFSRYNSCYGAANTVQPPAAACNYMIRC